MSKKPESLRPVSERLAEGGIGIGERLETPLGPATVQYFMTVEGRKTLVMSQRVSDFEESPVDVTDTIVPEGNDNPGRLWRLILIDTETGDTRPAVGFVVAK